MKTPTLHSPFIDGEVLGAPAPSRSPFEQVMAEPKAVPLPAIAATPALRVVDAQGNPLSGVAWSLHQGNTVLRGTLDGIGEATGLTAAGKGFDRSRPFRFHVEGHVCSIVSGAVLRVDDPAVEYGGSYFDWHAADSADPALRSAFWKDYAERRQRDETPTVFQFIQHDHVMRRPVQWLKGSATALFQAQPLAIRLGPLVRYTDDHQARIWLELSAPGLVRVRYGAAPDPHRKPTPGEVPASVRTKHLCSVRVGGRHYALLTLDDLPADAVVMYTLELAPQPPVGPLPGTEIDFTEAAFPRALPQAVLDVQQAALRQVSINHSHWLFLRTLPKSGEGLRFAHGSCRVHPGDADEHGQVQGPDMLARFGTDFLAREDLPKWPQFFMHTGDQIYADDIGMALGRQIVRQRYAATEPGPRQGDGLLRGAWAGRFALRHVSRKLPLPMPPAADVDDVDRQRNTTQNPARVQQAVERARAALKQAPMFAGLAAPAAQKLQVLNQLLWQPPIDADDVPVVDARRGLLQAPTFRILKPAQRDLRLPHPAAGDIGGVHLADYAEYAAAYEQAWRVPGARCALAHLPHYMIFDDHEVTDDWNADAGWLACVHHKRDALRMWPGTMTDALAAYWLYQGWGNLAPAVAAADPRVMILERARHQGHDALPELRRLIHDRAIAPTAKETRPTQRAQRLNWNFRVPTPGTPFLVVDLRTDREVHGKGGMSQPRLDWLETALRAARTRSAFIVLPVPLLMPAPMMFAMRHPWVPTLATGADSVAAFRRTADIEHPATNLVWDQFRELLRRLQNAGSPLKTLAVVSGDIHFSCNLDGQLPESKTGPRLLQLVSSGLRKVISKSKQDNMASAYRGWLNLLSGSKGIDQHRGVRMTLGGVEGPGQKLANFVFPTSVAMVEVVPTRDQPIARVLGDTALIKQTHWVARDATHLDGWSFNHATRAEGGWMTLNDPGLSYTDRPDAYPRDSRPMGLVREASDEAEDIELVHETLEGEAEPTLELLSEDEDAPQAEEPAAEAEIIGKDQRRLVPDPLDLPHRWICALDVFIDLRGLGRDARHLHDHTRASGVLIGPRHVLTARHVLTRIPVEVDGQRQVLPASGIRVTPGRCGNNDEAPLGQAKAVKMLPAPPHSKTFKLARGGTRTIPMQDDYALLILDKDLAPARHQRFARLGWWGEDPQVAELCVPDEKLVAAGPVTVAGYPGDTCGKSILDHDGLDRRINHCRDRQAQAWASRMWQDSSPARLDAATRRLRYEADTYPGDSGSPVFARHDGRWQLLAVHSGSMTIEGADDRVHIENEGESVSARMLDQLCAWINDDAGHAAVRVDQGRLLWLTPPAATKEAEDGEVLESEDLDDEAFEDEAARGTTPRSVRRTAALLDRGLTQAEAWLQPQPRRGVAELLRFAVSMLRTHFIPRGHGVIDAAGQVLVQATVARIAMKLKQRDGSPAPFEHRVRLWISALGPDNLQLAGRHSDASFSSITLYAAPLSALKPTEALQHAVHEMMHMLFTLVDRLRQRHGDALADAFLQRDPWRLLDVRPYARWRDPLQQALVPLLRLLGSSETAADAANRLVEEACAFTLAMHLRFALDNAAAGSKSGLVASSVTELLIRTYVLERSARGTARPDAAQLEAATAPLRPVLDQLQDALNATWQGGAPAVAHEAPSQQEALAETS